jgi:ribose transport system permease protein
VNTPTWIMVVAVVLLAVVLARTTADRYMYAAGGNAEAARLAGVGVQLIKVATFVISGGAAALGGLQPPPLKIFRKRPLRREGRWAASST